LPAKIDWTPESVATIVRAYRAAEKSTHDLAREWGVAVNTIRGLLLAQGVQLTNGPRVMSRKRAGRPSVRKGAKHSEEAKRKMSLASRGHKRGIGRAISDGTRAKMSASRRKVFKDRPELFQAWRAGARKAAARTRLSDAQRRATARARSALKAMLRRVLRRSGQTKVAPTERMLGYSRFQLIAHLESQFDPGMAWSVSRSFHIDHIVPITVFLGRGVSDPRLINSLSNLRPLGPRENQSRSNRYDPTRWKDDYRRIYLSVYGAEPERVPDW
jgi:NUMOD3 motif